jgi:ribosomal protein L16/L10AE
MLTRSAIWRLWTRALRRAGIEHRTLHAARRTAARRLLRRLRRLRAVRDALGHVRSAATVRCLDGPGGEPASSTSRVRRGRGAAPPDGAMGTTCDRAWARRERT